MSNHPVDLYYSADHEWARVEGDLAYVGVSFHAQSELGDIVFVDLPAVGAQFAQNDCFGSVEAVKTVAELYMPVAGEVVAVNEGLNDQPELVNSDPHGAGWMIQIRMTDVSQLATLMNGTAYQEHIS